VNAQAHRTAGWRRVLDRAWIYEAVQDLLVRPGTRARHVGEFVRPFPGCRILDIGCGTAAFLAHLPADARYVGYDMNPGYIAAARRRWGARGEFICSKVDEVSLPEADGYNIVLANGILHHLADGEAAQLFALAHRALVPGGRLVTYDNVYIDRQPWLARWLIARDRGRAVRTRAGYEALAFTAFTGVRSTVLHDTLRLPYTILVMECSREDAG